MQERRYGAGTCMLESLTCVRVGRQGAVMSTYMLESHTCVHVSKRAPS